LVVGIIPLLILLSRHLLAVNCAKETLLRKM